MPEEEGKRKRMGEDGRREKWEERQPDKFSENYSKHFAFQLSRGCRFACGFVFVTYGATSPNRGRGRQGGCPGGQRSRRKIKNRKRSTSCSSRDQTTCGAAAGDDICWLTVGGGGWGGLMWRLAVGPPAVCVVLLRVPRSRSALEPHNLSHKASKLWVVAKLLWFCQRFWPGSQCYEKVWEPLRVFLIFLCKSLVAWISSCR